MRIYMNPLEAVQEVERDLFEMGIITHPKTMQDKHIEGDDSYATKEVRAYSFKVSKADMSWDDHALVIKYMFPKTYEMVSRYIRREFEDRTGGVPLNPGNSCVERPHVWDQFKHDGLFAYTYSERFAPQLGKMIELLRADNDTRQAIITIHTNLSPLRNYMKLNGRNQVDESEDFKNTGGSGRIPCSMYYQLMAREGKVDLVYCMRSCDFLTHFPIDITLAMMFQEWVANQLGMDIGVFTYFTGSLHAYQRDLADRGIF